MLVINYESKFKNKDVTTNRIIIVAANMIFIVIRKRAVT